MLDKMFGSGMTCLEEKSVMVSWELGVYNVDLNCRYIPEE